MDTKWIESILTKISPVRGLTVASERRRHLANVIEKHLQTESMSPRSKFVV